LTPEARLGATKIGRTEWSFLVWAPRHDAMAVRIYHDGGADDHQLRPSGRGYLSAVVVHVGEAPDYRFVLADGRTVPDPASAWQPEGVHGPSRGYDPLGFAWHDAGFSAPRLSELVTYEIHVGAFTPAGTFDAAIERLDDLAELGVTAVELMPVAAFPGVRNWGYDGVFPFAAQASYGGPAGLQRLVDACHRRGLAVILDVVYNHLGPEGNVLGDFAPYFTDMYATPWGAAVNVAEAGSDEVRRYFTENAVRWLREFHFDGLRLDAIHGIVDPTASPFLRELTVTVARLSIDLGRHLFLIAESADNNPAVISSPDVGGLGFDAQWSDDFHHALHAVLTGERDSYYADYGPLLDLARAINDGFVYQGDYSVFRGRRHGAPPRGIPLDRFVVCAQNHDQVGNRAGAERLSALVSFPAARLAAAVLLLSPATPLLFMGEEYAEAAPFPYFVDHGDPQLLEAVRQGRAEEFHRAVDDLDPAAESTFKQAQLGWSQRESGSGARMLATYQALLACRRDNPVLTEPDALESTASVDGHLLTLLRRVGGVAAFAVFNVADEPVEVTMPVLRPTWRMVMTSETDAEPAWWPTLAGGDRIPLGAYGFGLYLSDAPEGSP
jgi:maltooligosyltrehalose trehalohydrolase